MLKADYGTLSFVMTFYATATGLGMLSIPDSLLYFLPRLSPGAQRTLVAQSMRLLAGLGLLAALAVATVALVPALHSAKHGALQVPLLLIAAAIAIDFPSNVLTSFLLGTERHRVSSLVAMSLSLVTNLAFLVPAAFGAQVSQVLAAYLGIATLRLAVTLLVYRGVFRGVAPEPFAGGLRAQLRFSVPLSLNTVADLVNRYFSTYVIGFLFSSAVFADYAVGAQELPFIGILSYSVAVAMLPRLSAVAAEGADRLASARAAVALWHTGIEKVSLLILPIFVFCLIEADTIIVLLYQKTYAAAALPFRVFVCLLPLRVTAYGTMLMALGQPRGILRSQLIGISVNTAINLSLVAFLHLQAERTPQLDRVGLVWAACGSVAAQMTIIATLLRQISLTSGLPLARVFPWRPYRRRFLAAAVAGLTLLPWTPLGPALGLPPLESGVTPAQMVLWLGLRLVLFAAAYLTLAHALGLLTEADRRYVWQWLRMEPLWRRGGGR